MPVALDTASDVCFESADENHSCRDGQFGIGEDESVELEIKPAFASKAAWLAGIGEAPRDIAPARKGGVTEFAELTEVADNQSCINLAVCKYEYIIHLCM
jgi:hypothetical protein